MLGALSIAAGYACLIVAAGWPGVFAAAAHVAVMLLAMKRR